MLTPNLLYAWWRIKHTRNYEISKSVIPVSLKTQNSHCGREIDVRLQINDQTNSNEHLEFWNQGFLGEMAGSRGKECLRWAWAILSYSAHPTAVHKHPCPTSGTLCPSSYSAYCTWHFIDLFLNWILHGNVSSIRTRTWFYSLFYPRLLAATQQIFTEWMEEFLHWFILFSRFCL